MNASASDFFLNNKSINISQVDKVQSRSISIFFHPCVIYAEIILCRTLIKINKLQFQFCVVKKMLYFDLITHLDFFMNNKTHKKCIWEKM